MTTHAIPPGREDDDIAWLDDQEQVAWRSFLRGSALVLERVNRDMVEDNGITFNEYEVLVRLSEEPEQRARMSHLAKNLVHSRSRLTHTVSRLEKAGYVTRYPCEDDRRGIMCELTRSGFEKLDESAPRHVQSVRLHLLNHFTREEFIEFGALAANLLKDQDYESL